MSAATLRVSATTGRFEPSAVSGGRRCCTSVHHQGPRWLPVIYFAVSEWTDFMRTTPKRYQAHCQTCQRIATRVRNGSKPLRSKYPTPEARRKRRRELYKQRTAEQKADARAYARDYADKRRRAEGVKPRRLRKLRKPYGQLKQRPSEPVFPSRPITDFLAEMVHRHGISAVARATGLGLERLGRILDGQLRLVTLVEADRICTGLNCPEQLAILYPEMEE